MKILLTGFEPFGKEKINPAWEAVKRVRDLIGDIEIVKVQVPTEFTRGAQVVLEKANIVHPDVVLCVGQAGGRAGITVEKVGINLIDARMADNAGRAPIDEEIVEGGPAAYFATVPVKAMVEGMRSIGIPASVSYTAGTYVCNELLYRMLNEMRDTEVRTGFIHVPYLMEQVVNGDRPSMALEDMVKGLEKCIEVVCKTRNDSHTSHGTEM